MWKPYGVAMDRGRLYICDTVLNNVLVYDLERGGVRPLSSNIGADILRNPINIAIGPDGTKYVADALRHQVVVFGSEDQYLTSWGRPGEVTPCDVAVAGDLLLVADVASDEVEIWDRATGEPLRVIGSPGNEPGQFHGPTNIAIAPDGTLYVTETHNFRVQHLTLDGEVLSVFGEIGTGFGRFSRPKGVAVDPSGRVYVVDAGFSNVQIVDEAGRLLMFISGPGPDPSHLDLPADVEIVTDPETVARFAEHVAPGQRLSHLILVSSQFGEARVNIYGFLAQPEVSAEFATGGP
jgi:DNA-binding beta-propeller fold protein YncE